MEVDFFREYCLSKGNTTESQPFGFDNVVFKLGKKIFAILSFSDYNPTCNLKCSPEYALELREKYPQVKPGYHMNKQHWNTLELNTGLGDEIILELIDHSYTLIANSLSKSERIELGI